MPFFSIIIPTCNQSKWIEDSVNGVLNQIFTDFELIVSDDSENEETFNLIKEHKDPRLKYFKNSPSLGRVQNYRTCVLERAKGEWFLICDGDDFIYDTNYLKKCFQIIKKNSKVVMIQAGHSQGTSLADSFDSVPNIPDKKVIISGFDYFSNFEKIQNFSHLSTISNLSYLKHLDPFRKDILSSDIETYMRLACFGSICLLKETVGLWRQHGSNASSTLDFRKQVFNTEFIIGSGIYWSDQDNVNRAVITKIYKKRAVNNLIYILKTKNRLPRPMKFNEFAFFFKYILDSGLLFRIFKDKLFLIELHRAFTKMLSN